MLKSLFRVAASMSLLLLISKPAMAGLSDTFQEQIAKGRSITSPKTLPAITMEKNFGVENLMRSPGLLSADYYEQSGYIYRATFDTRLSPQFTTVYLSEQLQEYIAAHTDHLGVDVSQLDFANLKFKSLSETVSLTTIPLLLNQAPVRGGFFEFSFAQRVDGKLLLRSISNQTFPGIVALRTNLAAAMSEAQLREALAVNEFVLKRVSPIIYPKSNADGYALIAGYSYECYEPSTDSAVEVIIRDDRSEILEAFRKRLYENTQLLAQVYQRSYKDPQLITAELDRVQVTNANQPLIVGPRGIIGRLLSGNTVFDLQSSFIKIRDAAAASFVSLTRDVATGDKYTLTATNNELRALNTFSTLHRVHRFVRQQIADVESDYLRNPLTVMINVNGNCNAFYNGSISLFSEGTGCSNMALVNDVMVHEWGHGLDDFTGRNPGITDGAYSEGIGDILAAYFSQSPIMGVGFFTGNENGVRRVDNTNRFPDNITNEVHNDGLIIGGAFWDLRLALVQKYGQIKGSYLANRFFLRHLLASDSYREAYQVVLDLDDNDGNPATKSANFCLISKAFALHGLSSEPACVDPVIADEVPVDKSVTVGFLDVSRDDSAVAISTEWMDSRQAWLCLDGTLKCEGINRVALELEGKSEKRLFYKGASNANLNAYKMVRVVLADNDGAVVAARMIKLVPY